MTLGRMGQKLDADLWIHSSFLKETRHFQGNDGGGFKRAQVILKRRKRPFNEALALFVRPTGGVMGDRSVNKEVETVGH